MEKYYTHKEIIGSLLEGEKLFLTSYGLFEAQRGGCFGYCRGIASLKEQLNIEVESGVWEDVVGDGEKMTNVDEIIKWVSKMESGKLVLENGYEIQIVKKIEDVKEAFGIECYYDEYQVFENL